MFERFTEKARRVIFFARYEASQYGSMSIETEHLLLGLMREDRGLVWKFLRENGGVESIRREIESQITRRERLSTAIEIPISAECTRILSKAAEEAERLGTKFVGTEHILLGILHEHDCMAARILQERGLTRDWANKELSRPAENPQTKLEKAAHEIVSVMQIAKVWGNGQAAKFARMFAEDGQFVDLQGNLWIGPERIHEAARLIFATPGWARSIGKIEDVQFVGSKAAMATLIWESSEKLEKPNPGCVRMTIILTQKTEGWSIVRVQATGIQLQSQSAAV
jgi:uncharacterized protein (TIGR02246 family)